MQNTKFLPLAFVFLLAACSTSDNPYARIEDGPLIPAQLHAVTLVTDSPALLEQLPQAGYTMLALQPNYEAAVRVQSMLWDVSEEAAGKARILRGGDAQPDLRVLVTPLEPSAASAADAGVMRAFYRNVLGTDVPQWPEKVKKSDNVRVQVWTYFISDVLDARRKLRAHTIPTASEPVGITTSYLGDEKTMTLRAPDGTIVELVQTAAQ